MAFHPEDRVVASCSEDSSIKLWNLDDGDLISTMTGHQHGVSSVHFSPDGTRLVTGSYDKTVKIWNPATGEELCQLSGEKQIISVAFSPDGSLIAAGDGDSWEAGTIRLYNAATGDPFGSPLNVGSLVWSVSFSPAGDIVAAGCDDGTVQLIDVATAEVKRPLRGHRYTPSPRLDLEKNCI